MSPEMTQVANSYIPPVPEAGIPVTEIPVQADFETQALLRGEYQISYSPTVPNGEAVTEQASPDQIETLLTPMTAEERNRMHLEGLVERNRVFGIDPQSWEWQEVLSQLVAIGYPVQAINQISFLSNTQTGRHNHLAHWDPSQNEMAFYDLHFDRFNLARSRAEVLEDSVHESAHMTSPFDEENDFFYGGKAERESAAMFVDHVVDLALFTNEHIDGYHRMLMDEYRTNVATADLLLSTGAINSDRHTELVDQHRWKLNEETHAILAGKGITNRKGLELYEERVNKAHDDKARTALPGDYIPPKMEFLTHTDDLGAEAVGVDTIYLNVLQDINSYDQLVEHVDKLKQLFYSDNEYQTSRERTVTANPIYFSNVVIRRLAAVVIRTDDSFTEFNERTNRQNLEDELDRQEKRKKRAAENAGRVTELALAA